MNLASHSVRFDELAVALPCELAKTNTHPLLLQMIQRLQHPQILENIHNKADIESDMDMTSQDANRQHAKSDSFNQQLAKQTKASIAKAKKVLDVLTQTEIADASVLVLITNEPTPKLMLTRRASHLNSHAGEVSFAGGKYEPNDGNNVVTALREACEETALPPSRVHIVGQLPVQTSKSGLSVRPIVALTDPDVIYVPELGEIERIFWAELTALLEQPTVDYEFSFTRSGQTMTLLTPSWRVDGETVWGLTGRIIANLFAIAFDKQIEWYFKPL